MTVGGAALYSLSLEIFENFDKRVLSRAIIKELGRYVIRHASKNDLMQSAYQARPQVELARQVSLFSKSLSLTWSEDMMPVTA